ncbi:MBOAT family O-acyltransferase [Granulicella mallensis]|uniref:Membrane bound O-acyl transferase MBOAT family protein n=1 Tax=Granulicella mallensis (strain ATCC BAA-1857 / DSM 23137 / MP5ACTX8) TaxID=682795 RepID=G8NRJ5_GRAMM|nr:MBOAT family O-acyltransferase [Granulicella mallensis]AEU37353.1 membrane bound O-acyl transferase MBOAT family protein [Granulicella mallensis MP5ACTX8]
MLFNSFKFIFCFLPITMVGFHLLGRLGRRPVIAWLALCSIVFYAVFKPVFVFFLLGSIVVNYLVSMAIASSEEGSSRRRQFLTLGITLNLLALFYFKYLYKTLLLIHSLHLPAPAAHPVLLPLGISFFTFTQISYLVDLAQGQAERQDLLSYVLFVTFFPHLIIGPILHHKEMMPQFAVGRRFRLVPADVSLGITWFLFGLGKKVLIADRLSGQASLAFAHAGSQSAASAWTGLILYTMQLYFDFSGYSDMALGLARIFSIRFPLNFDSPYKATSVTEYWQRWHMTLTRYVTLYLYNPILLGVQRRRLAAGKKISRKALATVGGFSAMVAYPTIITMLLTGLWHGAGLQFLLFGLLHGIYLTANQAWRHFRQRQKGVTEEPPTGLLRMALRIGVYLQVSLALIFFRADSLHSAFAMLHDLFGGNGRGHIGNLLDGALGLALFPIVWFMPNTQEILGEEPPSSAAPSILLPRLRWSSNIVWGIAMAVLFFAILANLDHTSSFLYFQF